MGGDTEDNTKLIVDVLCASRHFEEESGEKVRKDGSRGARQVNRLS
jgi:hypothetical protein